MRRSVSLKTLLRTPLKTLLTFLLIAAASFALFSKAADYSVTMREIARAKDFYRGVGALDNTVRELMLEESSEEMAIPYSEEIESKPWPSEEQLEEFASLPGVTLADRRYMTAGLVGDYPRLEDTDYAWDGLRRFVAEGTYAGYEDAPDGLAGFIGVRFEGLDLIVSDDKGVEDAAKAGETIEIKFPEAEDMGTYQNPFTPAFFDKLAVGSKCLILGQYNDQNGFSVNPGEEELCVIDGLGEDYLDTEAFAYQKRVVDAIRQSLQTYDIVYTSDMRAIPRFNEHTMALTSGRFLTAEDTDACVVSELFLKEYGLSVGDRVTVRLGDKLFTPSAYWGARATTAEQMSDFVDTVELEIVGAYQILDDASARGGGGGWAYTIDSVFVPRGLLPVEAPDDQELLPGQFSVLIEDPDDIEEFQEAAMKFASDLGISLRFSDGGWLNVKDSFELASQTSLLTAALYAAGGVLALLLAAYLYVGRNKEAYAIMRTLGVPAGKAASAAAFPFAALSAAAMPIGGAAGVLYTARTVSASLAGMAKSASSDYTLDASIPAGAVLLCLILELALTTGAVLFFLHRMQKIPPLELIQGDARQAGAREKGARRKGARAENGRKGAELTPVPAAFDAARLQLADGTAERRGYGPLRHVSAYILRHMRRGGWKTAASLALTAVLAAGIGMFVLARLAYGDVYGKTEVEGRALIFSSSSILDLEQSDLIKDIYFHEEFDVRINGQDDSVPMTFTNDMSRCVAGDYTVAYADGYGPSFLENSRALCLLGQDAAKEAGVRPGDRISLISDAVYTSQEEHSQDEGKFRSALALKSRQYTVVGIVSSENEAVEKGIFAGLNYEAEAVYGQPFPISYCEFALADKGKLDELDSLLGQRKTSDWMYAPTANYYVDALPLNHAWRICGLLDALFPIAAAAVLAIGIFGTGLAVLQSAKEAALLRAFGTAKGRVWCMMAFGQALLCAAGILFAACGLAFYSPGLFARSARPLAACCAWYLAGCSCGALAAAVHATRRRVLGLLQAKE